MHIKPKKEILIPQLIKYLQNQDHVILIDIQEKVDTNIYYIEECNNYNKIDSVIITKSTPFNILKYIQPKYIYIYIWNII